MAVNPQSVTIRRYEMDRYGDRAVTATIHLGQCIFAPKDTSERNDRSTTVTIDADLYVPLWSGIKPQDVVELQDGSSWEVQGEPEPWQSPFGGYWSPGSVAHLRQTRG